MKPLISLIIPVYNVEAYFKKCMESILAQTYENFEVILVDDGSTDASGKMCDEYAAKDSRIRALHLENGGVCRARNRGIDEARGEFISFIDADDWVSCQYLEKLVAAQNSFHADWTVCIFSNDENGHITAKKVFDNEIVLEGKEFVLQAVPKILYNGEKQILGNPVCKLYRRELLNDHHIRYSEEIKLHEDRLFNYVYAQYANSLYYFPESLYTRIIRPDSAMHVYRDDMLEQYRAICREYASLLKAYPLKDYETVYAYTRTILMDGNLINLWLCQTSDRQERKKRWQEYYMFLSEEPMRTLWQTIRLVDCKEPKTAFKVFCIKYRLTFLIEAAYRLFKTSVDRSEGEPVKNHLGGGKVSV